MNVITQTWKPLVSLIVPAYNEASNIEKNLSILCRYMESIEEMYRWELIVVNDGSRDDTGILLDAFADTRKNVRVIHHRVNFGLGQALRSAFNICQGDYVITMDSDLSYSPEHIGNLLTRIRESGAKVLVASPYMEGGKISNVPWLRRKMSVWANRFLSTTARGNLSTLTGMVRAYDGKFLRSVNLKAMSMDINPEVIYKAQLLRARIEEIPAHLDWSLQRAEGARRKSSMKIFRHTLSVFLSGFLFKPFMFFIIPGVLIFLFALYVNTWMFIHFFRQYARLTEYSWFLDRASAAVGAAYNLFPYTFIVGLLSLMLSIQLISLGILALQSKKYFEEMFHLGTAIFKASQQRKSEENEKFHYIP